MANNCYIATQSTPTEYFAGWNMYGEIVMDKNPDRAYFMRRILADRTKEKIEKEIQKVCEIHNISSIGR